MKLYTIIETAKLVIDTISEVVSKVCEILDIAPLDENTEELGAKVMQEGTRPKCDEETTQEYLDYLRNEVTFDKEKFDKMTPEEKLVCGVLGTSMKAKSIEEKVGVELPPEFLITIEKSRMKYEEVERYIKAFAENGITSMGEFSRYISNDMTENEASKVGGVIKGTMKELSSEMSDEDIQNEIISMKKDYFSSEY